jgi:predicted  nucleic acid-binding Zn ribbon protein
MAGKVVQMQGSEDEQVAMRNISASDQKVAESPRPKERRLQFIQKFKTFLRKMKLKNKERVIQLNWDYVGR